MSFPDYRSIPGTPGVKDWTMTVYDISASGAVHDPRVLTGTRNARLNAAALGAIGRSRFTEGPRTACVYPFVRRAEKLVAPDAPAEDAFRAADATCPRHVAWAVKPTLTYPAAYQRRSVRVGRWSSTISRRGAKRATSTSSHSSRATISARRRCRSSAPRAPSRSRRERRDASTACASSSRRAERRRHRNDQTRFAALSTARTLGRDVRVDPDAEHRPPVRRAAFDIGGGLRVGAVADRVLDYSRPRRASARTSRERRDARSRSGRCRAR